MKKILTLLLSVLMVAAMFAIPARRTPFTVVQSDGTVLTLVLVGDEHLHYYENVVTGEIMTRGDNGDYYVVGDAEFQARKEAGRARRAAANERRMKRMPGPAKVGTMGTMTGQKRGIVILVNFADKAMTTGTQSKFDNMFNQTGYNQDGHIGSVADYFKAQSYGQFELAFDVVGPVTLDNNMAYYGGNDSRGNDLRPGHMAREACVKANAQGVDFSKYDWDGDGYVDQVFVIYAGYGENYNGADPNTIWPHEWDLVSAGTTVYSVDGVKVKTYACCAELYGTKGSTLGGMGTACHEFSHCLGYPDSYDTDYSGGIGMDSYDVMCGGSYNGPNGRGEVPAGYTAYERWMAGWLTPTELSQPANVTSMKDLGSEGDAYIIYNSSNRSEYFMLENRQSRDWFRYYDSSTAGHGLFITHIDYNSTVWGNNEPNDDPNHQRMTWVPADKNYGTYSSTNKTWSVSSSAQQGDYFPGTSRVTAFKPTASAWNTTGGKWFTSEKGSYYMPHEITEITENTTAGTISFLFDGGATDDGSRYTVTLQPCGGTVSGPLTWTQSSYKEAYTLPEPSTTVPGWEGAGWSTTRLTTPTPLDDVDLIDYGLPYTPQSDVTLYAVYMDRGFMCHSTPANFTVTLSAGSGTCTTSSWTQDDSYRTLTLPTCTIASEEWTFAGWTTAAVSQTTTRPTTLLKAGEQYTPTADVTLYAVFTRREAGGGDGSYTLDVAADESGIMACTKGYGSPQNYTAADGGQWVIKAYWNDGMQINKGKDASIRVPECPGYITSINITTSIAKTFSFATTDYTGGTTTAVSTSSSSTTPTLQLSGKGLTGGYIYTTDGATAITRIVVNYSGGGTTYYATSPELTVLPTPTIAFAEPHAEGKTMHVGDTYTNIATASLPTGALPAVMYTSSRPAVATVDASGRVVALAVGTTTITASVAAVDGQYRQASASYTVEVAMPTLQSIAVTTEPAKKDYNEDETFDDTGLILTATYANGFTRQVTGYTINPTTLLPGTTLVTISYTEGAVTATTTVDGITVVALPRYAARFFAGGVQCGDTQMLREGQPIVFPEAPAQLFGKSFQGWSLSTIDGTTATAPTFVSQAAMGTAPADFYAVYATVSGTALDYSFTIKNTDLPSKSYAAADGPHTVTARCTTDNSKTLTVGYTTSYVFQNPSTDPSKLQWKTSVGTLYNTTDLGTIKSVSLANASNIITYYGATERPTSDTQTGVGKGFFNISAGSSTGTASSITVTFTHDDTTTTDYCTTLAASLTIAAECTDGEMYYSTYSNPYSWLVPEDLVVMEVGIEEGRLLVVAYDPGSVVPGGTGVMVASQASGTYTIPLTDAPGQHPDGVTSALRPSGPAGISADAMAAADAACSYYRLTMHEGTKIGFWWGAPGGAPFSLAAGKAYLVVPASMVHVPLSPIVSDHGYTLQSENFSPVKSESVPQRAH